MFQLLRRVSRSLLPRPDRPWREDATSNAPTIGRKRRHSVAEQDTGHSTSSTAKRVKNGIVPDTEINSASESGEKRTRGDVTSPVEGQDVKEVTKGVKEVGLEDKDKGEDPSSTRPEGIPLPDSPSGSPEPESESKSPEAFESDIVEETEDRGRADDDSVASSSPKDRAEEGVGDSGRTEANIDTSADETAPAQEAAIAAVASGLHDTPEELEVNAQRFPVSALTRAQT